MDNKHMRTQTQVKVAVTGVTCWHSVQGQLTLGQLCPHLHGCGHKCGRHLPAITSVLDPLLHLGLHGPTKSRQQIIHRGRVV
jgi:hypothetical protein